VERPLTLGAKRAGHKSAMLKWFRALVSEAAGELKGG
jgi:hypothetical protein